MSLRRLQATGRLAVAVGAEGAGEGMGLDCLKGEAAVDLRRKISNAGTQESTLNSQRSSHFSLLAAALTVGISSGRPVVASRFIGTERQTANRLMDFWLVQV